MKPSSDIAAETSPWPRSFSGQYGHGNRRRRGVRLRPRQRNWLLRRTLNYTYELIERTLEQRFVMRTGAGAVPMTTAYEWVDALTPPTASR
jgi:hypothetical protein